MRLCVESIYAYSYAWSSSTAQCHRHQFDASRSKKSELAQGEHAVLIRGERIRTTSPVFYRRRNSASVQRGNASTLDHVFFRLFKFPHRLPHDLRGGQNFFYESGTLTHFKFSFFPISLEYSFPLAALAE